MTEKEQCLKLIDNLIKKHEYDLRVRDVLKALRKRIRLIGTHGGPLNEPLEPHSSSLIKDSQQAT
jgi:phosphomevalonate kinase